MKPLLALPAPPRTFKQRWAKALKTPTRLVRDFEPMRYLASHFTPRAPIPGLSRRRWNGWRACSAACGESYAVQEDYSTDIVFERGREAAAFALAERIADFIGRVRIQLTAEEARGLHIFPGRMHIITVQKEVAA